MQFNMILYDFSFPIYFSERYIFRFDNVLLRKIFVKSKVVGKSFFYIYFPYKLHRFIRREKHLNQEIFYN